MHWQRAGLETDIELNLAVNWFMVRVAIVKHALILGQAAAVCANVLYGKPDHLASSRTANKYNV